jgi:histidyl-tRNA synthetase
VGVTAVLAPAGRSLRGQMRYATAVDAPVTLVLGEDEATRGVVAVKDMAQGGQREVPTAEVVEAVRGMLK